MDLLVIVLVVGAAAAYSGWKAWGLIKPGKKAGGCGCGSAKSGCTGCPMVKP